MAWTLDARVPVRLGDRVEAGPDDALLIEGECFDAAPHPAACACCTPRSAAAAALDRLFQRRARGEIPFFRRVLAVTSSPEGDLALWTALRADPVVSARFRLELDGNVLVSAS